MKSDDMAYNIWQRVDVRRELLGLTLEKLANLSGLNKQTIKDQRSRNIIPRSDYLYRIAAALRCSMEYLIAGKELDNGLLEYLPYLERCPADRLSSIRVLLGMPEIKRGELPNSGLRLG